MTCDGAELLASPVPLAQSEFDLLVGSASVSVNSGIACDLGRPKHRWADSIRTPPPKQARVPSQQRNRTRFRMDLHGTQNLVPADVGRGDDEDDDYEKESTRASSPFCLGIRFVFSPPAGHQSTMSCVCPGRGFGPCVARHN